MLRVMTQRGTLPYSQACRALLHGAMHAEGLWEQLSIRQGWRCEDSYLLALLPPCSWCTS